MRTINNGFPLTQFNGININTSILSSSANYYSYGSRDVKYVVIHYTGNSSDTAKANANYFSGGSRSEMCCSGNYTVSEQTISNTAYLCAELCKYIGITADTVDTFVLRHYDVWDKQCPAQWATNNSEGWIAFKEKVKAVLRNKEGLTMEQYNELKNLIEKQAAAISALQIENKELKAVVQSTMVYDYNDGNMPSWARTAVQAAQDYGALVGDEQGRLGLSYKDLRTICREYRCGMYDK